MALKTAFLSKVFFQLFEDIKTSNFTAFNYCHFQVQVRHPPNKSMFQQKTNKQQIFHLFKHLKCGIYKVFFNTVKQCFCFVFLKKRWKASLKFKESLVFVNDKNRRHCIIFLTKKVKETTKIFLKTRVKWKQWPRQLCPLGELFDFYCTLRLL